MSDRSRSSAFQPQQQSQFPDAGRAQPTDNSDLERLERLKKEILEGQNPAYKAIPQPDYLESLYLGRLPQQKTPTPPRPSESQADAPSKDVPNAIEEVQVKKEEAESPLPGFQMSDILALSSKVRAWITSRLLLALK